MGQFQSQATHCKHGHEFDEANTYWMPDGRRCCRTCRAAQRRKGRALAKRTPASRERKRASNRRGERRRRNAAAGRHPREVLITVPNAPLREYIQAEVAAGRTNYTRLASALGWVLPPKAPGQQPRGDTVRLKRKLGMIPSTDSTYRDEDGHCRVYMLESLSYDVAVKIAHAVGALPAEVGV